MNFRQPAFRWLLMAVILASFSAASFAQVFVSVRIGPPALPVYAQPICPGPGYIWTPGYWGWNDDGGYYWVPGTWVVAPVGLLWTPGYWGWGGGLYVWHAGYWGPHVGFYGGINYGFGYGGVGFVGGEWRSGAFYYNRSVTNVSVTNVTNVYNKTVIVNNTTVNNVSYNGGEGGVKAQATAQERIAEHEQHTAPLSAQAQHETAASQNRQNFARVNQGKPAIAATAKPGDFSNRSAIPARAAGAAYHPPAMSPKEARGPSTPPKGAMSSANSNNNRPVSNSNPATANKSNQGFRSFTPPNSNNSQNKNATANSAPPAANKSNQGFKPFTPPNSSNSQSKNGSGNAAYQHPAPQPKPSAPRPESHRPSPPPKQSPPPREEHHHGK